MKPIPSDEDYRDAARKAGHQVGQWAAVQRAIDGGAFVETTVFITAEETIRTVDKPKARQPRVQHGVTCQKVDHLGSGYLHGADDDRPYDVDNVVYCGRGHQAL